MLSIIIPTLWKSNLISKLVEQLNNLPHVSEIIIIDNDLSKTIFYPFDKVSYIKNDSNNYVNPSWNQGVLKAKEEIICLMSDDVMISDESHFKVMDFIKPEHGVIGLSQNVYTNINNPIVENMTFNHVDWRNYGFGPCIFLYKSNYNWIPEQIKIMYGDDWIFYTGNRPNFVMDGINIWGKISASEDKEIDINLLKSDFTNFWNLADKYILNIKYDEDLFSSKKRQALLYYKGFDNINKFEK